LTGTTTPSNPCVPGYYCPAGSIDQYGRTSMSGYGAGSKACPAGTYSSTVAATSISTCIPTPPGTYSLGGAVIPIPCPGGTYSTAVGAISSSTCEGPCPAGKYAPPGSTSCISAPPGTYSPSAGAGSATPCPGGTYSTAVGATSSSTCGGPCPAGTYAPPGSTSCIPAPPGSYSPSAGAASATPCPPGYHGKVWESGATSCHENSHVDYSSEGYTNERLLYCPPDDRREVRKKVGNEFLTDHGGRDDWYWICQGRATRVSYKVRDYIYPRGFYPF